MEKVETPQPMAEQKSSVKVTKNSKGYGWEVKIYDDDPEKALNTMIELELECHNKYGEEPSPDLMEKEVKEDDK